MFLQPKSCFRARVVKYEAQLESFATLWCLERLYGITYDDVTIKIIFYLYAYTMR
jgi:hypothetical protein